MFTTWTSANRQVSEALTTTFDRVVKTGQYGYQYYEYTRIRTMSYEYVGLTEAAAKACAQALNTKFNRHYCPYIWDSDSCIWKPNPAPVNNVLFRKQCGTAKPQYVGGCMWKVSVQLNEQLSQPFRNISTSVKSPQIYYDFENTPEMATDFFKGFTAGDTDYDYDQD